MRHELARQEHALAALRHNIGFDEPHRWSRYAIENGFRPVCATPVPRCPDCGKRGGRILGQYVYYSTLIRLRRCPSCGLAWADAHLDPEIVAAHFERAYKDDGYFARERRAIFSQLTSLASRAAPLGGRVLDIGGAQGHLGHRLRARRPDLSVVVNDLSHAATRHARERFGLEAIGGGIAALEQHPMTADVVLLSDVLYYEPRLASFWRLLPRLVRPEGSVLIRVPNRWLLLRLAQAVRYTFAPAPRRALQTKVASFQSEHIYVLSRRYLAARLRRSGFEIVRVRPSPPRGAGTRSVRGALLSLSYAAATLVHRATRGWLVITPAMVVEARRTNARRAPRIERPQRAASRS